jgi:hypothetical protein
MGQIYSETRAFAARLSGFDWAALTARSLARKSLFLINLIIIAGGLKWGSAPLL